MAEHNLLGHAGEKAAAIYLIRKNYTIRSIDWQFMHKDIDIVAERPGWLVFVEVKTRSSRQYGDPEEAVDEDKRRNLIICAKAYLNYYKLDMPYRFDIISVVGTEEPFEIEHIIDAFHSSWNKQ